MQERFKHERGKEPPGGRPAWMAVALAVLNLGSAAAAPAQDKPVKLGEEEPQEVEELTGESALPLQVTGFAVGNYNYDGRTKDNSVEASKLAVSLFREMSPSVWFFGQLTTALAEPDAAASTADGAAAHGSLLRRSFGPRAFASSSNSGDGGGEEVATEIEIDNLIINFTPPGASQFSFSLGKFDDPLGFERDDEPLNLQASTSFTFELGRPIKLIGLVGRWNVTPSLDVTAMVTNGWESQIDPNHGKSVGGRVGLRPTENTSLGVGGMFGPEGAQGETRNRYVLTADYSWQPTPDWIFGGEASYGGDHNAAEDGTDANWVGGTLTVFRRFVERFGLTARAEVFDDRDGARTGERQTLESFTLAPVYFVGTGTEGIFANIEHTTFRIPRFQVRGEVRMNHSNIDFFETSGEPDDWNVEYRLQLVTTF
ncbi:MAG: outer membrane beta-barrel protein [Gemmatimonadota bacterium]